MAWNPDQYLKFAEYRLRPAVDLLNRVAVAAPRRVVDLGCGAGNVTRLLRERWPEAAIVGVDSSPDMLAKARQTVPDVTWQLADLATWEPAAKPQVMFSNAALHWLDDHQRLIPRLLGMVAADGVLAIQMPNNFRSPSHTGLADTAASGPWRRTLEPLRRPAPVADPGWYWELLTAAGAAVDIWETEYLHVLTGDDAVVQWVTGTVLRPFLDALDSSWQEAFLADYRRRMAAAYPRRADGSTLFPFRRLFIVAQPAGAR